MKFTLTFLFSSYLLILLGLVGLTYTGEVSLSYIAVTTLSLGLSVFIDTRSRRGFVSSFLANVAIVMIFLATAFSVFFLGAPPIQELVHFLLALQAVKMLTPKKARDWLQLYLLSFFSVVAASALSVELSFAAIFLCYLFLAPWVLILLQLKEAAQDWDKTAEAEISFINFSLIRLAGLTGLALLTLTFFFFLTFPRLSVRLLADTWSSGSAVTGFSDLLTLGQFGEIQRSSAVAMRVSLDRTRIAPPYKHLYWRGITLDLFDGRRWQKSAAEITLLRRRGETYLVEEEDTSTALRQSIVLEPNGSAALFALGRPTSISGRLGNLYRDPLGNLRVAYPSPFQVAYEVASDTREAWFDQPATDNFLQLPLLDPRVAALAQTVAEVTAGEEAQAYVLQRFLQNNYGYSLEGLPQGNGDPLAAFLFDIKKGNCEYFASALAVMLRIRGIPARVVNGYVGGDWNPYGGYYLIRQSDAHSWVEAYVRGKGWIQLDPTPPAPQRAPRVLSPITYLFDFLQLRWYRYVVNFSFAEQRQLLAALRRPDHWFAAGLRGLSLDDLRLLALGPVDWVQTLIVLVAGTMGLFLLSRRVVHKLSRSGDPYHRATDRYQRFLRLAGEKKALKKRAGETPEEFGHRANAAGIDCAWEMTTLYQKARFSGLRASKELAKMDDILTRLKKI
jgi:transglutaminase-like putative cysteine protease